MRKRLLSVAIGIPLALLLGAVLYNLPPIHDRLAWRVEERLLRLRYQLHPPAEVVFVPQGAQTVVPQTSPSQTSEVLDASEISPTPQASTPTPAAIPTPSPTPAPTSTPLPAKVSLTGVRYEDQHGRWNYCAPANLAMALSYWGWQGNRDVTGPVLKPDEKDKNVMPYEMADFVTSQTDLQVTLRVGGDLGLVKSFLAAGFPVLIEKGTYLRDLTGVNSWMGHYAVVTGYDDATGELITQDSFIKADYPVPYDRFTSSWRAFNYTYLVIYPADKEAEVAALLGPDADEAENYRRAAEKASAEIYTTTGIDQFFAWYNRGSSLVQLQDYAGAAQAYDEAFAVYPDIPEKERPWRMLWYQTGPYFAYFYAQRYYDVLTLATNTLDAMQSDKNLEETYYWRAMAKNALGDSSGAIEDFRLAVEYHPGFGPAVYQLGVLGVPN